MEQTKSRTTTPGYAKALLRTLSPDTPSADSSGRSAIEERIADGQYLQSEMTKEKVDSMLASILPVPQQLADTFGMNSARNIPSHTRPLVSATEDASGPQPLLLHDIAVEPMIGPSPTTTKLGYVNLIDDSSEDQLPSHSTIFPGSYSTFNNTIITSHEAASGPNEAQGGCCIS